MDIARRWLAATLLIAAACAGPADDLTAPAATTPRTTAPSLPIPSPTAALDAVPTMPGTVTRVIDGDTIDVRLSGGAIERVRFIGVDTPESTTRVEPLGKQAAAYTAKVLPVGTRVVLELDVDPRDRYDRLLAYVWLRDPTRENDVAFMRTHMVNAVLLLQGYAQLLTVPPNVRYVDVFTTFQTEARKKARGLWGLEPAAEEQAAISAGGCDASYPTVCIPPPPPDLDCGDISHRKFKVVGDDAHGFDGDGDGVGCES